MGIRPVIMVVPLSTGLPGSCLISDGEAGKCTLGRLVWWTEAEEDGELLLKEVIGTQG